MNAESLLHQVAPKLNKLLPRPATDRRTLGCRVYEKHYQQHSVKGRNKKTLAEKKCAYVHIRVSDVRAPRQHTHGIERELY